MTELEALGGIKKTLDDILAILRLQSTSWGNLGPNARVLDRPVGVDIDDQPNEWCDYCGAPTNEHQSFRPRIIDGSAYCVLVNGTAMPRRTPARRLTQHQRPQ